MFLDSLIRQEVDDSQFLHVINKQWTDHCRQMVREEGGREEERVGGWVREGGREEGREEKRVGGWVREGGREGGRERGWVDGRERGRGWE